MVYYYWGGGKFLVRGTDDAAAKVAAALQYLVLHLLHLFLWLWSSGAAQAAQFVRIIFLWL